jgi:ABC-type transport system substrate-binding protein
MATARAAGGAGTAPPQIVKIGWPEPVTTLNLGRTTDIMPMIVMHLVGGTLMNFNSSATGVVPGLAQKEAVSKNGLTYTFTLRPSLKFSDGTPLTAQDVKATFDAQRKDKANANAADFTAWKSVSAPNSTTVKIGLSVPQPSLPEILAAPWHAIFPASASSKGNAFFSKPISDGPYMVQSYASDGTQTVLSANPDYWGAKPVVPQVQFTDIEDENTRILQLKAHQIDVAGELSPSSIPQLTGGGVTATVNRVFGEYYIWTNDRKQPLSDLRVREAISDAVDRNQLNKIVWAGKNVPNGGLFAGTMKEHVNVIPLKPNIAKAKALLKGTACANGCSIQIMVRNGRPIDSGSAIVVQHDLKQIGINLEIQNLDNATVSQKESSGNFDTEIEWLGLPLDIPDTWLNYAMLSTGGVHCLFSGYDSPVSDALVNKIKESSGSKRAGYVAAINRLFGKDLPYVPLVDAATILGWNTAVMPYVKAGPTGFFDIASA